MKPLRHLLLLTGLAVAALAQDTATAPATGPDTATQAAAAVAAGKAVGSPGTELEFAL